MTSKGVNELSLQDLIIKREYRSTVDDIVNDFYIPILARSSVYKRSVGFFSSAILVEVTKGLSSFIKNNGKMYLIASPLLSPEDVEEIKKGYSIKELIEKKLIKSIVEPYDEDSKERLSWIAYMISMGLLEIKLAYIKKTTGMFHEKVGVFVDSSGDKIAFSGSINDTFSAVYNNYESFDVFKSWIEGETDRVNDKESAFDQLWSGRDPSLVILDFPEAAKAKLLSYHKEGYPNFDIEKSLRNQPCKPNSPHLPAEILLFDYQNDAIVQWEKRNFRGIFDMATGTGKTLTGLGAITKLYSIKNRCAVVIVCPYQHLVEQWVEDVEKFNIKPIIAYSASKQKKWKEVLQDSVIDYNIHLIDFFCIVTTNATFKSTFVQQQLNKIYDGKCLVVDEAHNFGAEGTLKTLNVRYEYRLALSATLERHNDIVGTEALLDFFGEKCIEYSIEKAINEGKLTPYKYYPILVCLEDDEYSKYILISKKISASYSEDKNGNISEYVKMLMIERSRIIAGARNKITALKTILKDYKNDSHILVYCGSTKMTVEDSRDPLGERQIVEVSKMIGNELGIMNTHFTSNESPLERQSILRKFANADPFKVLVAIKCLDEGVNVPSIKTAFILASSTNPKEYIQRRGRVLRKYPGKDFATIYDFVTLPRAFNEFDYDENNNKYDIALVKKEIKRIEYFRDVALNPMESDLIINELIEKYNLDLIGDEEFGNENKR